MQIENYNISPQVEWNMGAGDEELCGKASLSETIHIDSNGSSRIAGRHCGIARFEKSRGDKIVGWVNSYDEAFFIIGGRGRFIRSDPPYEKSEAYEVGPGDYFYIPRVGARLQIEPLGDEPFEWFYCAGKANPADQAETVDPVSVHNLQAPPVVEFQMGAGEDHLFGKAQLRATIRIDASGASQIDGRHCGVARFIKGEGHKVRGWVNWYDEAFYVISGRGRFTTSDNPHETQHEYDLTAGDYLYMPRPTRIAIDPIGDEPFIWFYCAGFGDNSYDYR